MCQTWALVDKPIGAIRRKPLKGRVCCPKGSRLHCYAAGIGSNSATGWVLRAMDRAGNYYDALGRLVLYCDISCTDGK